MDPQRIEELQKEAEQEFPGDFALQQVHIARKLLAEEAKQRQMSFWQYVKTEAQKAKEGRGGV